MNKLKCLLLSILFVSPMMQAQELTTKTQKVHINQNKFRQLKDVLATQNSQRTASGAPGINYSQQKVDYVMSIVLDLSLIHI